MEFAEVVVLNTTGRIVITAISTGASSAIEINGGSHVIGSEETLFGNPASEFESYKVPTCPICILMVVKNDLGLP